MRTWISLGVLFVAVSALGAWVYLKPAAREGESHVLSVLTPPDVKRIELERAAAGNPSIKSDHDGAKNKPSNPGPDKTHDRAVVSGSAGAQRKRPMVIVVERHNAGWRMLEPYPARADLFQVERLLAILETRSAARYAASQLERYGLDEPQVKLTLNDQSFTYGAINTMTREQYVLTRDTIYTIPLAQRTTLPQDADALVARALFAPDEMPTRFEFPSFTATLDNGRWSFAPADDIVSADDRNAWAAAWRQLTALRTARHDGRRPASSIGVRFKDGRAMTIGVLQRAPELVLLRSDEGLQYHFAANMTQRLLSPPAAPSERISK